MSVDLPPMFPGGCRIDSEEEAAVVDVIRRRRLFRYYGVDEGPSEVDAFEPALGEVMGTRHVIAVSSGTAALVAALAALGVGPGDQVIVPAYTWISTAAAVLAVGAVPVVANVDESLTLDPADVESLITRRTRVIIPVHMRGAPADMSALTDVARRHGLAVLEDAAQAVGGRYRGRRLGTIGDIGIYSLQFNKIITCGEGGAIVTDDPRLHARALMYHDVAATRRTRLEGVEPIVGVVFRMSELQGAVARVQLRRLDDIIAACRANRQRIISRIETCLSERGIQLRRATDADGDTGIALILLCPDVGTARNLDASLRSAGVRSMRLYDSDVIDFHVAEHWEPIKERRTWSARGPWDFQDGPLPPMDWGSSLAILGRAVHLDVSPDLRADQIDRLSEILIDALRSLPAAVSTT